MFRIVRFPPSQGRSGQVPRLSSRCGWAWRQVLPGKIFRVHRSMAGKDCQWPSLGKRFQRLAVFSLQSRLVRCFRSVTSSSLRQCSPFLRFFVHLSFCREFTPCDAPETFPRSKSRSFPRTKLKPEALLISSTANRSPPAFSTRA